MLRKAYHTEYFRSVFRGQQFDQYYLFPLGIKYLGLRKTHRGRCSDLPLNAMKPATNQAFMSFWLQMKKIEMTEKHQKMFSKEGLYFGQQKDFQTKKVFGKYLGRCLKQ